MLNQPSGKHSCLRYSTYVLLQMHKLCIDNANSEAIRTDKLIMYVYDMHPNLLHVSKDTGTNKSQVIVQ